MSVVASHTMHVLGVMLVLFAMVILNMLASSRCTQLQSAIGAKEKLLASLEKDRERESGRWEALSTLDRLENTLAMKGMSMKYPKPVQIVYLDANGRPLLAQNSVREAQRRQGLAVAAAAVKPAAAVSSVRAPRVPPRVRTGRRARR